jgi:hypothetical protein
MSVKHLDVIRSELSNRLISFTQEIQKIRGFLEENNVTFSLEEIENIYNYNRELITELGKYIQQNTNLTETSTYPFKTHKLLEIFDCSLKYAKDNFEKLLNFDMPTCNQVDDVYADSNNDFVGTSMPNCIFNIYASVYYNKTHDYNLIHPQTSSMVQTTRMPVGFDVDQFSKDFKNSMYYYKDEKSPVEGELLFTHCGYAFGGSREDERYDNKILKTYDCSSYVSSVLNSDESFSTVHMEQFYNNQCNDDPYCLSVEKVLKSKTKNDLSGVNPGDVFVVRSPSGGGHTGFVNQIFDDRCYEEISFNRNMPDIEGVSIMKRCLGENKNIYFFETID